ncbi:hypothetical protein MUK42_12595 [Musa troglodytarum]|uniref:Uncharacterized protein n=1 Tax=Musa troglodytarum TaxID=320322 RepID=A0A9E7IGP2_9LILI|nr:hypothetical protein MUK42_12595 [Musa troglodytarum]
MFRRETMYRDSLPFVTSNYRSAVEDLKSPAEFIQFGTDKLRIVHLQCTLPTIQRSNLNSGIVQCLMSSPDSSSLQTHPQMDVRFDILTSLLCGLRLLVLFPSVMAFKTGLFWSQKLSAVGMGNCQTLGQQPTCTDALCHGAHSAQMEGQIKNMDMGGMGGPCGSPDNTCPREDIIEHLMQLSSSSSRQRHTPHHAALLHLGRLVFRTHRALPNPGQAPPRVGRAQAAEMTNSHWLIRRSPGTAETLNSPSVLHPREMGELLLTELLVQAMH